MSISTTYSPATYSGNGVTTSFAITFPFLSTSGYVKVSLKDTSTGVITLKVNPTHYTISGSNVVFGTAPAAGNTVIVELSDQVGTDILQEVDYTEYDSFPAETHEGALDKLTLGVQAAADKADRAIAFDASVSGVSTIIPDPNGNAGKILVVNTDEDALEYAAISDLGSSIVLGTGVEDFLQTPSSSNLKAAVTDETGSGALVFGTSPTIATPAVSSPTITGTAILTGAAVTDGTFNNPTLTSAQIGTPDSGTLTNCTGLPISTGVSGLGSNVATMLGTFTKANVVTAGGDLFKGYELLTSTPASSSASVVFTTLSSTYSSYIVVLNSISPATDGVSLYLTFSSNGGSTYHSVYQVSGTYRTTAPANSATGGASAAQISLNSGTTIKNNGLHGGMVRLVSDASTHCVFESVFGMDNGSGYMTTVLAGRSDTIAVNAIKFTMSSGNIAGGRFSLYGLRI